jgi:hypothetical protein
MNKQRMLSGAAEACRRLPVKAGSKAVGALLMLALLSGVTSAQAATCVGGQWGSINYGDWTVYVDEWGSSAPCQVCANGWGNWWVSGSWSGGGVKIYAHSQGYPRLPFNGRYWVSSNFNVSSPPNTGAICYDWCYDMWTPGHADEIMILESLYPGAGGGWGSKIASNVTIGGHAFDVWQANPGWNVIQFVNKQLGRTSGTEDLYGIMNWCKNNGRLRGSSFDEISFGVEVTASNGWQTWTCNSFWAGWGTY